MKKNDLNIDKPEMRLFIDDKLLPSTPDKGLTYDFEKEFEKSAKNKPTKVIFLMLGAIFLVAVFTFGFSYYLDAKNKQIKVGINVFDDLNLMKLLDRVSRLETSLRTAQNDLETLKATYNNSLAQLRQKRDTDLMMLNALRLSAAETQARTQEITDAYNKQRNSLTAKFNKESAALEENIALLKNEIQEIDSANVQRAHEQKAAIDSQRQLFELEKKAVVAEYEAQIVALNDQMRVLQQENYIAQKRAVESVSEEIARLDPVIVDERGEKILELVKNKAPIRPSDFTKFIATLDSQAKTIASQINSYTSDLNYVSDIVNSVPQLNSIPPYAKAVRDLGLLIGNDATKLLAFSSAAAEKLQNQTEQLQAQINKLLQYQEQMEYYLSLVANSSGDAGFILDTRNKSLISVFISPLYADSIENTPAFIFNKAGDLLGSVTLQKIDGRFFAVPDSNLENYKANDRILLNLTKK